MSRSASSGRVGAYQRVLACYTEKGVRRLTSSRSLFASYHIGKVFIMKKYRGLVLGLVLLAMLVAPYSAVAATTKVMHVYVFVNETSGGAQVAASGVNVNLYVPEQYGTVLASGTTNSGGYKFLQATFYVGDHAGLWIRRSSPGGVFNLAIPTRYCGTVATTGTDNWACWIVYNHDTGSCSNYWTALKPSR